MDRCSEQDGGLLHLYSDLAEWWPLLSAPADYAEEAGVYTHALLASLDRDAKAPSPGVGAVSDATRPTLLELGSGGGNNASHMKASFHSTLVDRSEGMLAVSRRLNPECEHHCGDMRTIRLGRTFDAVFIHDAVMYITDADDLRRVAETAFLHCRPGGVALFVPDCFRETYRAHTGTGGHDGDRRALRYLDWVYDPDPADTWFLAEMVYLLREADGSLRCVHDRHRMGLFSRQEWRSVLEEVGFDPRFEPYELSEETHNPTEMILALRPRG